MVLYPEVAFPTYLVGSKISNSKSQAVAIDATTWPAADLAWINSPSNPTGQVQSVGQLQAVINWGRRHNAVIASDECYLSFAKDAQSILSVANGDNLAGYRAAFIVGDPLLIAKIRQIRKHAGMMVPLPVQKAMLIALSDEAHVQEQAKRYQNRREILRKALENSGFTIEHSEAGLYIWCTRNEDCWQSVDWFAQFGVLVTPGIFYGSEKYIRIALTASDENINAVAQRMSA